MKDGSQDAWSSLYEQKFDQYRRYALSLGVPPFWAEDIVQNAMLSFFRALPRLTIGGGTEAYLTYSVRNAANDYLRGAYRQPPPVDIDIHTPFIEAPEYVEHQVCMKEDVIYNLARINPIHLPLFVDQAWGYTLPEIGERRDMSVPTIKGQMFREREKLRHGGF